MSILRSSGFGACIALAAAAMAAPAAAQCWSGGAPGAGVPRESLLVVNRAPFPVKVMAGPANGARRVLGEVPAGSTMRFLGVLPPGRNETVVWADPEHSGRHGVAAARVSGRVVIANRGELTCRRTARLEVTTGVFAAARRGAPRRGVARRQGQDLSTLAPAAGPQRRGPGAARATGPGRTPGSPSGGAGVIR